MTCSLRVSTTRPSATMFILSIVSRMTAKASLSDLTVQRDVVRRIDIAPVDLALRNELVDVDGARAFNLNGLELLVLDKEILAKLWPGGCAPSTTCVSASDGGRTARPYWSPPSRCADGAADDHG